MESVHKDIKVIKVTKGIKVDRAIRGIKEIKDIKATKGIREIKVTKDIKVKSVMVSKSSDHRLGKIYLIIKPERHRLVICG